MERNSIKAGLINSAEEYRWSSAKAHLSGENSPLLHEPAWLDPAEQDSYADYVKNSDTEIENEILKATKTGRPFGTEFFIDEMEISLNRSLRPKPLGRPRKG